MRRCATAPNEMRTEAPGFALALALVAMVVLGALVSAALVLGAYELRLGRAALSAEQARGAAEEGSLAPLAQWTAASYNQLGVGTTVSVGEVPVPGGGFYNGNLRRLSSRYFLVEAEGHSGGGRARSRAGLLVRLRPPDLGLGAALETDGETAVAGSVVLDGTDRVPPGWSCPRPGDSLPEVRIDKEGMLTGAPVTWQIEVGSRSGFDELFDELSGLATLSLGPGNWMPEPVARGDECSTTRAANWGDPQNPGGPCGSYFPVVYISGDAALSGGWGQGLLLVDGYLKLQGGVEFYGAVLVKGGLEFTGSGGTITGGAVVMGQGEEINRLVAPARIAYSSCAVERALMAAAGPEILPGRGWLNLY